MKFFFIAMAASFAYYAFPGYVFPILIFFSWVCWAWPHSITAQQIGSGYHGLGIGAFTLDWAGISAYHGSPLVTTPFSSILNVGIGFVMFIYIFLPLCYWKFNTFDARKFPIFSNTLFTTTGHKYDTTKILTPQFDFKWMLIIVMGSSILALFLPTPLVQDLLDLQQLSLMWHSFMAGKLL